MKAKTMRLCVYNSIQWTRSGRQSNKDLHSTKTSCKHYNSWARHKDFQVGDLVLRKVMGAARDPTHGKLDPNQEARPQLGRTLQNHIMAEERHLLPRDTRRTKVVPSMERQAPTKVLLVEMIVWSNTPQFSSLLQIIFSTILFKYLYILSLKGRSFSLENNFSTNAWFIIRRVFKYHQCIFL